MRLLLNYVISLYIMYTMSSLEHAEATYNNLICCMSELSKISINPCKLGIYNDSLYRSWNSFSGLQRRYYCESREKLCKYIYDKVSSLYEVRDYVVKLSYEKVYKHRALVLIAKCKITAMEWLSGINTLNTVYENDTDTLNILQNLSLMINDIIETKPFEN